MSGSRWVSSVVLTCLVVLCPVAGAGAAESAVGELTKLLPEDVVLFVASGGAAALEGDFQKTALARLCNDPGLRAFVTSIKRELLGALEREAEDEEAPEMIAMGLEYAQVVLGRPMVVGLARVEVEEGPAACVFAILDAGESRPELAAAVTKIETLIGEDKITEVAVGSVTLRGLVDSEDVPLCWGWIGNYLVLAVNDAQGKAVAHVVRPRTTATGHLAKLPGPGGPLAGYLDVRKLLEIVKSVVESEGGQKDPRLFEAVLKDLGLSGLGQVVGKVGFVGPHVVTDSFVEVAGPRSGLPAVFRPIDVSLFGMVDSRAARATAFNIGLAGLYDTVMKAIETASPDEAHPDIQKGLSEFESEAGFSIREDLLASLGGPVVVYQLPAGKMVEAPMGGFVVVAKLNDAALFEKTLVQIAGMLVGVSEGMLQVGSQKTDDGRTIHVWANPGLSLVQMMPTWSVAEDYVVIGSNTALCKMGIEQITGSGDAPSLAGTGGFKKVAGRLPRQLVSLTYSDSEVVLSQGQVQLQQFWPAVAMAAAQAGVKLPVMVPSLGHIFKGIEASCEYSYIGPDGYYSHYEGVGIEVSLRSVGGTALGMGILMPALARVRQLAFRMTSGTNLSTIGMACLVYADDHDGKLPPNLEVLVEAGDLAAKCLESKRRPDDFVGPSYVYIPGQTLGMNPGNVVAYEDPRFCLDGVNVLFMDFHVGFVKPETFRQALKETCARLGREMPDIQFREEMEADR